MVRGRPAIFLDEPSIKEMMIVKTRKYHGFITIQKLNVGLNRNISSYKYNY